MGKGINISDVDFSSFGLGRINDNPPEWTAASAAVAKDIASNVFPTLVGSPGGITYSSSVPTVASINSSTGDITLLTQGKTTIQARNSGGSDSYELTVYNNGGNIPGSEIEVKNPSIQTYGIEDANLTGLLLKANGGIQSTTSYFRSDYIPCKGAYQIRFNGLFPAENNEWTGLCIYDENKMFLWSQNDVTLPTVNNGLGSARQIYLESTYVVNLENIQGTPAYFRFCTFDGVHATEEENAKISVKVLYDKVQSTLVIGNSITLHDIVANTWWSECGMAASERRKDFVHLLGDSLKTADPTIKRNMYSINVATAFERQLPSTVYLNSLIESADLKNFTTLDFRMCDTFIIRLGENVNASSYSAFKTSLVSLMKNITDYVPNAKVFVTGLFWTNANKESAITGAVSQEIPTSHSALPNHRYRYYIQINQYDNSQNKQSIGNEVLGDDLSMHEITSSGVANHPNDTGMSNIAAAIYSSMISH